MSDIKLDAPFNDLAVENGEIVLVTSDEAIEQHLRIRLRQFLGEWFLDTREGVPYFRDVFVKNPNPAVLKSIFRQTIENTPGVSSVDEVKIDLNRATRSAALTFRATLDTGATLDFSEPFVIEI